MGRIVVRETFTQLTAAGSTSAVPVQGVKNHTFEVVVAAIGTSVTVRAECQMVGTTNWANMNDSGGDTTYTANGTYVLHKANFTTDKIRFTHVSEVGASVTLDVKYRGDPN